MAGNLRRLGRTKESAYAQWDFDAKAITFDEQTLTFTFRQGLDLNREE